MPSGNITAILNMPSVFHADDTTFSGAYLDFLRKTPYFKKTYPNRNLCETISRVFMRCMAAMSLIAIIAVDVVWWTLKSILFLHKDKERYADIINILAKPILFSVLLSGFLPGEVFQRLPKAEIEAHKHSRASQPDAAKKENDKNLIHNSFDFSGKEKPEVVLEYILAGGDPNAADKFGRTPLTNALSHCNVESVEILLKYGARYDVKVGFGKNDNGIREYGTPLEVFLFRHCLTPYYDNPTCLDPYERSQKHLDRIAQMLVDVGARPYKELKQLRELIAHEEKHLGDDDSGSNFPGQPRKNKEVWLINAKKTLKAMEKALS